MKKLVRSLLSVALIAAMVFSIGVVAMAADKEPFDFKIDFNDALDVEDVILQYKEEGEPKSLSVKEVLTEELYEKIGGRVVAESVAFDLYSKDRSYKHEDEVTKEGVAGTVTFPAEPEGGICCPDIIQVPMDLIYEKGSYIAYAICIGIADGTELTAECAVVRDGQLGSKVGLGTVKVKDNLAKIVISADCVNSLGAKNGDIVRIILSFIPQGGEKLSFASDHNFKMPKMQNNGDKKPAPKPAPKPDPDVDPEPTPEPKTAVGRHGIAIRYGDREIGLEAVPVKLWGITVDRVVTPYITEIDPQSETELVVHNEMFEWVIDLFDPFGSIIDYFN